MSADVKVGPAILINRVGRGQVITFACSPDYATASEHHIVEARRLIRNAVRYLNPEPIVEISAPASVEAVVTDDSSSRTLRVHLLCYNATPQTTPARERPYVLPGLIEDRPMFKATIRAVRPIKHASALNRSTRLTRSGNTVKAVVEDIHDVVLLRY